MISIEVSQESINLITEQLQNVPKKILRAQNKALTKTANYIKRGLVNEAAKRYNIPKGSFNKSFGKIRKIKTANGTIAELKSFGVPFPMMYFKPKPSKPYRKNRRTGEKRHLYIGKHYDERPRVTVEILRGKRTVLNHSFLAEMKSGHIGIFHRTTKKRLPIKEKYAPSIPTMLGNTKVWVDVVDNAEEFFNNAFEQELKNVLYTGKKK